MVEVSAKSILNRKSEKIEKEKKKKEKELVKKVRERELERMLTVCCSCCPGMDGL